MQNKREKLQMKSKKIESTISSVRSEKLSQIRKVNSMEEQKLFKCKNKRKELQLKQIEEAQKEEIKFREIDKRMSVFVTNNESRYEARKIKNGKRLRAITDVYQQIKEEQDESELSSLNRIQDRLHKIQIKVETAKHSIAKSHSQKEISYSSRAINRKRNILAKVDEIRNSSLNSTYKKILTNRQKITNNYSKVRRHISTEIDRKMEKSSQIRIKKYDEFQCKIDNEKQRLTTKQQQFNENRKLLFDDKLSIKREYNSLRFKEVTDNFQHIKKSDSFDRKMKTQKFSNVHLPFQAKIVAENDYQCERRRLSALSICDREKALKCSIALKRVETQSKRVKLLSTIDEDLPWKQYITMSKMDTK